MSANVNKMIHHSDIPAPWHGLSQELSESDSYEDRVVKAGFAYRVESAPIFFLADGEPCQPENRRAYYRVYDDTTDPRHREFEAVMSDRFEPVQPREMMDFYETLERETGCPLHVAGSLHGGTFFATAKIDKDSSNGAWTVAGENHKRYWLIASRNDGTLATTIGPTDVQVVCQNTLQMAMGAGGLVKVNHRGKLDWGKVRADLDTVRGDFPAFDGLLSILADIPVDTSYAADFVQQIAAPDWDRTDPKQAQKMPRTVRKLSESILYGPGQRERGTNAYSLLSGVTHYVDHSKQARSDENRFVSGQWGMGAALKRQAWDKLIRDCAQRWNRGEDLIYATRGSSYAPAVQKLVN